MRLAQVATDNGNDRGGGSAPAALRASRPASARRAFSVRSEIKVQDDPSEFCYNTSAEVYLASRLISSGGCTGPASSRSRRLGATSSNHNSPLGQSGRVGPCRKHRPSAPCACSHSRTTTPAARRGTPDAGAEGYRLPSASGQRSPTRRRCDGPRIYFLPPSQIAILWSAATKNPIATMLSRTVIPNAPC